MQLSDFWRLMDDEFGASYSRTLSRDLVIEQLGSRTAEQALAGGARAREVWLAVCEAMQVPVDRRWGHDAADKPARH